MPIKGIIKLRKITTLKQTTQGMFGYVLPNAFVINEQKKTVCVDLETEFFNSINELRSKTMYGYEGFIPVTRVDDNSTQKSFIFHFDLNPFFDSFLFSPSSSNDIELFADPDDEDYLVFKYDDIISLSEEESDNLLYDYDHDTDPEKIQRERKKKIKKRILVLRKKEFESKKTLALAEQNYELAAILTKKIEKIGNKINT